MLSQWQKNKQYNYTTFGGGAELHKTHLIVALFTSPIFGVGTSGGSVKVDQSKS